MAGDDIKNILVVNVNWIGDVIFSTPIFKALKRQYPTARIVCMAVPRVIPVLKSCPYIDEVIAYDEKDRHRFPWEKLALVKQLRGYHFDVAFLLHRSWTRAFLVFLAGVRHRVGYDLKNLGRLLTLKADFPMGDVHRSDYYLNVIEAFGVEIEDRYTALVPSSEARSSIKDLLLKSGVDEKGYLVVLNTGGNWHLKRWPEEYFAMLIDCLMNSLSIKVVISGAPKDQARVERVCALATAQPVVLAGKTTLEETFALMARADLVISADSGPLHIASSVGTATIAIFGPTRPEITGPRGKGKSVVLQKELDCNGQACYRLDCPDNLCMKQVSVEEVFNEVRQLLGQYQHKETHENS